MDYRVSTRRQIVAVGIKMIAYPIELPVKANIIEVSLKRGVLFIKVC